MFEFLEVKTVIDNCSSCVYWQNVSYNLFLTVAFCGSTLICEQSEGFWFCGLQLLLLREDHSVKVGQLLSLELWHLERFKGNGFTSF